MEQVEKIGSLEAIAFIVIAIINGVTLNLPNSILQSTGSSAWLNVIYITVIASMFCIIIAKLHKPFKNEDIVDVSEYLGGSILKSIIGILYILLFLGISAMVLKYLSECLKLIYYPTTPTLYILGFFVAATTISTMRGISGIVRNNFILLPFLLLSIIVIFVSTAKSFVWYRAFPIFGKGINETFFSGVSNIFIFSGFANIYFLMPLLKEKKNFKALTIAGTIISGLYLFLSIISLILAFSYVTTSRQMMSIYPLARLIEYGRFLQRIDAFFILFWILAAFSYVSTCVILALGIFKKITYIKSTKAIAPSFTLIALGLCLFIGSAANYIFISDIVYKYYFLTLAFVITPAILVLANVKWYRNNKEVSQK